MANDAYIKFGEQGGIEGDSYDTDHYFWCELRSCELLNITPPDKGADTGASQAAQDPKPKFSEVQLKKRVDWASTTLFMDCCYAGDTKVASGAQPKGQFDQVTVHVCRAAGEKKKIPFLIITYYNVQVTKFAIEMSGPEPSESISFQFETADFSYQRTDPNTGLELDSPFTARNMPNYKVINGGGGSPTASGTASSVSASPADGGASGNGSGGGSWTGGGGSGGGSNGSGNSKGGGLPASVPASPTEATAGANFPGLYPGIGLGVLPN